MTSKLKCPVCNRELVLDFAGENYLCDNSNCVMDGVSMMQKRWETLIQIKENLDDYKHNLSVKTEQHERGYAYATKTIKDLESKLEIARNALKEIDTTRCIPQQTLISLGKFSKTTRFNAGNIICVATPDYIHNTLEQIRHKEI